MIPEALYLDLLKRYRPRASPSLRSIGPAGSRAEERAQDAVPRVRMARRSPSTRTRKPSMAEAFAYAEPTCSP